jgi:hypothetical protein
MHGCKFHGRAAESRSLRLCGFSTASALVRRRGRNEEPTPPMHGRKFHGRAAESLKNETLRYLASETTCQGKNATPVGSGSSSKSSTEPEVAQSRGSAESRSLRLCGFSTASALVRRRGRNEEPTSPMHGCKFHGRAAESLKNETLRYLASETTCQGENATPVGSGSSSKSSTKPEVAQSLAFALKHGKSRRVSGERDSALPSYQAFFVPGQLGV